METQPQQNITLICKPYILFPLTPLHAGTGRTLMAAADLPVQKDTFGYPVLWGNSLKGALRSTFRRRTSAQTNNMQKPTIIEKAIFGPDIGITEDYASAITILEARLFALPVRSLQGVYAYVTTPHLLKRTKTLLEYLASLNAPNVSQKIQTISHMLEKEEKIPIASSNELLITSGTLVLAEETITNVTSDADLASDIKNLLEKVNLPINIEDISKRFVIIDDNRGKQLIRKSLLLLTRTALDYRTKTVRAGALWTEEYVPEMSLFYTTIMMRESKLKKEQETPHTPTQLLNKLLTTLNSDQNGNFYLILGGHETIGKGIVKFCTW